MRSSTLAATGRCGTCPRIRHSIALIEGLYAAGKPVAAVCHGPAAFRHAKAPDGSPLVRGRSVTGFANS